MAVLCRYMLFFLPATAAAELLKLGSSSLSPVDNFSRHKSTNENMKINPSTNPPLKLQHHTLYSIDM